MATDSEGKPGTDEDPLSEPPPTAQKADRIDDAELPAISPPSPTVESKVYYRLNKSLSQITNGLFFLFLCIVLNYTVPLPYRFYCLLYFLPLMILVAGIIKMPETLSDSGEWRKTCVRLKWIAFFFLLTSPFWYWWQVIFDNYYLMINAMFFLMLLALLAFNITSMVRLYARQHERRVLYHLSAFTRLAVIYLLIGPLLALMTVSLHLMDRHSDAMAVIYYVRNLYTWQKVVVLLPFLLVVCCLCILRRQVDQYYKLGR